MPLIIIQRQSVSFVVFSSSTNDRHSVSLVVYVFFESSTNERHCVSLIYQMPIIIIQSVCLVVFSKYKRKTWCELNISGSHNVCHNHSFF